MEPECCSAPFCCPTAANLLVEKNEMRERRRRQTRPTNPAAFATSSLRAHENPAVAENRVVRINSNEVYTGFSRGGAAAQIIVGTMRAGYDAEPACVSSGVEVGDEALHTHAPSATAASTGILEKGVIFQKETFNGTRENAPGQRATTRLACSTRA